jgi:hypothetical protein
MRRTASEVIRELEIRVARLERQASKYRTFEDLLDKEYTLERKFPSFKSRVIGGEGYLQATKRDWSKIFDDRKIMEIEVSPETKLYITESTPEYFISANRALKGRTPLAKAQPKPIIFKDDDYDERKDYYDDSYGSYGEWEV